MLRSPATGSPRGTNSIDLGVDSSLSAFRGTGHHAIQNSKHVPAFLFTQTIGPACGGMDGVAHDLALGFTHLCHTSDILPLRFTTNEPLTEGN
jgi:hypothetical protein